MQLRFDPPADRLMWQLRTFGGEMFAVWLTRRLLRLLWQPLQSQVTHVGIAQLMPHATVMPEAREMLTQAARERPLPNAQFDKPFDEKAVAQPLGSEPLLPAGFKLNPGLEKGGLVLELAEAHGRSMKIQLSADLATALVRLLEQALRDADWGLTPPEAQSPAEPVRPMSLN